MGQSFSQWQNNSYPQSDAPFRVAEVGGPAPFAHDPLDLQRMQWRQTPEATYPDGYLGTINSRRQDRLLNGLKQRTANRPNTRGIHKGEHRDPSDYFWPEEMHPFSALAAQAEGRRWVTPGLGQEWGETLVNDGKNPDAWRQDPTDPHPDRAAQLRRLAPPWGGPGMAVAYPGR